MSVRKISALNLIYQVRRVQRLSAIFAGSVFAVGALYSSFARSQKEKVNPIVPHALKLCRAFAVDCQSEGDPRFLSEQIPSPSTRVANRPMWYVPVRADGASYAMILRADTGRLCYAFNLSSCAGSTNVDTAKATQTSANLAVNQSLLYLKRLEMAAPETQIALARKPESLHDERGWRIVWKTRSTSSSAEESFRIVISQKEGHLLQIANTAGLNQAVK